MGTGTDLVVRRAGVADTATIGRLLHDFNTEYDEPTPGPVALAERVTQLLQAGQTAVLLGGGRAAIEARTASLVDLAVDLDLERLAH